MSVQKPNIRILVRLALIACLILFPTILILAVNAWTLSQKQQTSVYALEITDKDGRRFSDSFSQGAWPDSPDYESLSFGRKILYVLDTAQPELQYDVTDFPQVPHLTVRLDKDGAVTVWGIQFLSDDAENDTALIRRSDENLVRRISGPSVTALKSDRNAACLYPYADPPRLELQSVAIVPSSSFWKFRTSGGKLRDGFVTPTINLETYQYSGTFRISFNIEPTSYTVTVSASFGSVELQTLEDLCTLINSTENQSESSYEVQIHAQWDTEQTLQAYGWMNYRFRVINASETRFFLNLTDGCDEGALGILTCKKIAQPEKLVCLAPDSYPYELSLIHNGSDVVILIPFPAADPDAMEDTSYTFRITYDIFEAEFTVPVRSLSKSRNSHTVRVSEEVLDEVLSDASQAALYSLQRSAFGSGQQTPLFRPEFSDLSGARISIRYGDRIDYGPGESTFSSEGTFFSMPLYSEVTCLNSGVVLDAGHSDYLGYYVIVDHGAGLKTWYTGLSSPCVSIGEAVRSGDVVGYSGNTSFLRMDGTYVFCTLRSAYVSVEELMKTGLNYKNGEN